MRFPSVDWGIRFSEWRDAMPDYEVRYFHADGTLAIVHMVSHASEDDAHEHARRNQKDHARFELRAGDGSPLARR
jgi:hypothetical protein